MRKGDNGAATDEAAAAAADVGVAVFAGTGAGLSVGVGAAAGVGAILDKSILRMSSFAGSDPREVMVTVMPSLVIIF